MIVSWDQAHPDPKQSLLLYIDMLTNHQESIKNHSRSIGGLYTELAKLNYAMQGNANEIHTLFRDWFAHKLEQLGQGIATITNSLGDKNFLKQEVKLLKHWMNDITAQGQTS